MSFQMAKPVNVAAPRRDDICFFTEGRHADVEFLVEHGSDPPKSFKAHKMVLAMRNEVFETMFYGSLPEKNQVRVTDLHPDGFSAFLKYLYSKEATFVNVKQALHTRAAAQKYMESELVEACHKFIRNSMQSTDVCDVLEYVVKNGNLANFDDLINKFLNMSGFQVLESKAFIAASKETVLRILKDPQLNVKEYNVIKSVYAWAIARCGTETGIASPTAIQSTMRPFLPELRFLTLSPLEFVEGPITWNILTESEALAVLSNIVKHGSKEWPVGFSTNRQARTEVTLGSGQTAGGYWMHPSNMAVPVASATKQSTTNVARSVGVTPGFGHSKAPSSVYPFG
ncbi:BTB/POZ domain-containing protein 6-like isoform X1 [Ixodes scapularis]|uniref:BTB/POZ domain-containing protein 6-like isoform X1 n=2 Tax=Ixodes scapularis TaxID=6945 RepID=UPI001A9E7966|nr:BTB/POZ domain-containing protein 6-like isoform X1 [Ixodes scapularis]